MKYRAMHKLQFEFIKLYVIVEFKTAATSNLAFYRIKKGRGLPIAAITHRSLKTASNATSSIQITKTYKNYLILSCGFCSNTN